MGAVALLLAFAGIAIYYLITVIKEKDKQINAEIEKRETLLTKTLESHHASIAAIQLVSERLIKAMEDLEGKIDATRTKRQN